MFEGRRAFEVFGAPRQQEAAPSQTDPFRPLIGPPRGIVACQSLRGRGGRFSCRSAILSVTLDGPWLELADTALLEGTPGVFEGRRAFEVWRILAGIAACQSLKGSEIARGSVLLLRPRSTLRLE